MSDTEKSIERMERMMERLWHTVTLDKDRTWSTSDVAAYLDVSETQVRTLVKTNGSFPAARRYEVGKGESQPRWVPDEIKDWFQRDEHKVSRAS